MLHYKRKWHCPILWMLPLGNESKGIYSQYSQPLAKKSAGITWSWTKLAVRQARLWIKDFRAATLSRFVSSWWVCEWEYRARGNRILLPKQDCSSAVLVWEKSRGRGRQQLAADPASTEVMLPVRCCRAAWLLETPSLRAGVAMRF